MGGSTIFAHGADRIASLLKASPEGEGVHPSQNATLRDVQEDGHRKEDDVEAVRKNALVALHEAFDIARRQLQELARRQRGDVKTHHVPD
jgi:hypothetical protein